MYLEKFNGNIVRGHFGAFFGFAALVFVLDLKMWFRAISFCRGVSLKRYLTLIGRCKRVFQCVGCEFSRVAKFYTPPFPTPENTLLVCLESQFAVHNESNCHRFAAISNRTIRIARSKTVRIAVKALLHVTFNIGFQSRDSIRFGFRIAGVPWLESRDSRQLRSRGLRRFQIQMRSSLPPVLCSIWGKSSWWGQASSRCAFFCLVGMCPCNINNYIAYSKAM